MYMLNGVDRINSLYTSFSILSSSYDLNSMRLMEKIAFVKVCYNWLTNQSDIYIGDMVIKISLGATEKPCMKSLGIG